MSAVDAAAWEEHLVGKELAPNTVSSYLTALAQFSERHDALTKANVVAFKRELLAEGKAPKTVNCRIGALNQCAEWAGVECGVRPVRVQRAQSVENAITVEQKDKMLGGLIADGDMNGWAMVLVLSMTGARVAEVVQMRKRMLADGYQVVSNKGKVRRVYAPAALVDEVRGYYEATPGDYLVFAGGTDGTRPMTTRGVADRLKRYARRYGIPAEVCHPHAFRHMFGIEFMKANGNISLLADLMGHSSVSTTQIYARMSAEEQKRQLDEVVTW